MKIGLLGDIHGNIWALRAVLAELDRHKITDLFVSGDIIGYYFYPKEVFNLLEERNSIFVKGNHEDMLIRARRNPKELKKIELTYGSGLRIALESLSKHQLDRIENMPESVSLKVADLNILLCHGTPTNPATYLYPNASPKDLVKYCSLPYDFVILGHTHYPMDIKEGSVRLVNPGSVGQPRTKEKAASWAILETETSEVTFKLEKYDSSALIEECRHRHPEIPYLAEVLCKK